MRFSFIPFIFFLQISYAGYSQNLVSNGDFEKMIPTRDSKLIEQAIFWSSPKHSKFDVLKSNDVSGNNLLEKSTNRFAGIVLFDASNSNYRTYAQVKLSRSLKVDEELCFWISVSAANHSFYFTDQLGIAVTNELPLSKNSKNIEFSPQLKTQKYQALNDTSFNWKKLKFNFKAQGGEQFISIGNFRNDAQTLLLPSNAPRFPKQAYLYIDNIYFGRCDGSIEEIVYEPVVSENPHSELLPQGKMHVPNILTPNKDGFNDFFFIEGLPRYSKLSISNKKGNEVFKSENYRNDWDGGNLPPGTYQFELLLPDGNRIDGPLDIVRKKTNLKDNR